jgi:PAS domain S-box-containing protein
MDSRKKTVGKSVNKKTRKIPAGKTNQKPVSSPKEHSGISMDESSLANEQFYRSLYQNATLGMYRTTPDGRILMANPILVKLLGYDSFEQLAERDLEEEGYEPGYPRREFQHCIEREGNVTGLESSWRRKDGSHINVRESAFLVRDEKGQPLYYEGTVEDITEHKQSEQALRESEEKYRLLVEKANEAILVAQDGMLKVVNPMACELTGYSEQELTSKPFPSFIHPDDRQMVVENYSRRLEGKTLPSRYSFRLLNRDGSIRWVEIGATRIEWLGRPATLNFISDISERKQAEEALRLSQQETAHANGLLLALGQAAHAVQRALTREQVFSAIQQQLTQLGYYATGFEFAEDGHSLVITYLNYAKDLIRKAEKLTGLSLLSFRFRPRAGTVYQRILREGETIFVKDPAQAVADTLPARLRSLGRPIASLFKLYPSIFAPLKVGGETIGLFAVTGSNLAQADIPAITAFAHQAAIAMQNALLYEQAQQELTERKQAEQALRESEERFSRLSKTTSEGIVFTDQGIILDVNLQLATLLGCDPGEMIGLNAMNFVAPESLDLVMKNMKSRFEGPYEHLAIRKDGSTFPVEVTARTVPYKGRQVRATVIRDISGRKRAQALQDAVYRIALAAETTDSMDDLYQQIHQNIATVMPAENFYITLYDQERNLLHFPYFKDVQDEPFLGEIQPGLGLTAYVLRNGKSLLCTQAVHDELERQGAVKLLGVPSAIWLGVPLIIEGKTIGAMVVQHYSDPDAYGEREQHMLEFVSTQVATAINRKQAEETIRESEQKYRTLFENIPDGVFRTSPKGQILSANPALVRMLGFDSEEELKRSFRAGDLYLNGTDRDMILRTLEEQKELLDAEIVLKRRDGSHITLLENAHAFRDENDRTLFYEGVLTDITARKQVEQALRESEERYRAILDGVQEAILVETMDGRILAVNQGACQMYGYEQAEFLKKTVADLVPEGRPILKRFDNSSPLSTQSMETVNRRANGELFPIEISGQLQTIDGEQVLLAVVRDITERKQAEEALRRSEQRFRAIIEHSYDAITLLAADGTVVYDSPSVTNVLGYEPTERVGRKVYEFVPAEQRDGFARGLAKFCRKKGATALSEANFFHKDGTLRWIEGIRSNLLHDPAVQAVVVNYRDSTERKQREKDLQASEIRYRRLFEAAKDGILILDADSGSINDVNPYLTEMFSYPAEELLGKKLWEISPFHDIAADKETFEALKKQEYLRYEDLPLQSKSGRSMQVEFVCNVYLAGDTKVLQCNIRDITERSWSENALRQSETQYRLLAENMVDVIWTVDSSMQFTYVSPSVERLRGFTAQEALSQSPAEALMPASLQAMQSALAANISRIEKGSGQVQYESSTFELEQPCKDGSTVWTEAIIRPLFDEHDNFSGFLGVSRDITERKRAQALQDAVYRIALAAETTDSMDDLYQQIHQIIGTVMPAENFYITLYDQERNLLHFPYFKDVQDEPFLGEIQPGLGLTAYVLRNGKSLLCTQAVHDELERQGAVKLLGVPSAIWLGVPLIIEGKTIGAMVVQHYSDPHAYSETEQHMLEFVSTQVAIAISRKQAEEQINQLNASLEQRVEERTRQLSEAQEKLIRQERLAALGQLAGGVGHELRNPLGVIAASIYYLKLVQPEAGEKVRQHLKMIEQEVHTAEKIISDLLDFGRALAADRQPLSVPELVDHVLARFPTPETVKVVKKIPAGLPLVLVDPTQMEQVLGNLVTNACQAMTPPSAETNGGKLTLSANQDQGMIAIHVKDTGTGISPENMKKIFEPLFTTKARGIGLGLAVSQKLVVANGGRIEVQSQPGQGSTFTLFLPVNPGKGVPAD